MLEHVSEFKRELPADFNWIAILKDLVAGAPYTTRDAIKLKCLSSDWVTCACGQLCSTLSRNMHRAPRDPRLYNLGHQFHAQISVQNWVGALDTIHKIEARSCELLGLSE